MENENLVSLGVFTKPRGLKGELRLIALSSNPQNLLAAEKITVKKQDGSLSLFEIVKTRIQGRFIIMNLKGINSIEKAEELRGAEVLMKEEDLKALPENTFYNFDLIGLSIITDEGHEVGKVLEVHEYPTCDTLETEQSDGTIINIPMLKEVVLLINIQDGIITVSSEKLKEFLG